MVIKIAPTLYYCLESISKCLAWCAALYTPCLLSASLSSMWSSAPPNGDAGTRRASVSCPRSQSWWVRELGLPHTWLQSRRAATLSQGVYWEPCNLRKHVKNVTPLLPLKPASPLMFPYLFLFHSQKIRKNLRPFCSVVPGRLVTRVSGFAVFTVSYRGFFQSFCSCFSPRWLHLPFPCFLHLWSQCLSNKSILLLGEKTPSRLLIWLHDHLLIISQWLHLV